MIYRKDFAKQLHEIRKQILEIESDYWILKRQLITLYEMNEMIKIQRKTKQSDVPTYGELFYKNFKCKTMELPWLNNQVRISCIPAGVYDYEVLERSEAIPYKHIWIKEVPGRSGIKIHVANYVRELRGCIAVGRNYADIDKDGVIDLTASRDTLNELMTLIPTEGTIEIEDATDTNDS